MKPMKIPVILLSPVQIIVVVIVEGSVLSTPRRFLPSDIPVPVPFVRTQSGWEAGFESSFVRRTKVSSEHSQLCSGSSRTSVGTVDIVNVYSQTKCQDSHGFLSFLRFMCHTYLRYSSEVFI